MEHVHCFAAIDAEIRKERDNRGTLFKIIDTYCCLECGERVQYGATHYSSISEINNLETEMLECYDYLCMGDIDLLCAVYKKIKANHPDISNEDMGVYICAALYNMETKEVTESRQKKRVLRLGLNPDFNNWNKKSVIHYENN